MILAIDVGLKNLSMCVMSRDDDHVNIHLWDVYDIIKDDQEDMRCTSVLKNDGICGKLCKYKYVQDSTVYTCKLHFPKTITINKDNIIVPVKVKDINLQNIALLMIDKLQSLYASNTELFDKLDKVVIELQPKCNDKMKLISHIIYGKMIDILRNNTTLDVKFIRATQKLNVIYDGPEIECTLKDGYAKRKYMTVQYTKYFLDKLCKRGEGEGEGRHWKELFESIRKKDDMADVFCYCVSHLFDKKKKVSGKAKRSKKSN